MGLPPRWPSGLNPFLYGPQKRDFSVEFMRLADRSGPAASSRRLASAVIAAFLDALLTLVNHTGPDDPPHLRHSLLGR
jgi:hypothetical protein